MPVVAKRKQPTKCSFWLRDCPVLVPLHSPVHGSQGNLQARLFQMPAQRVEVILTTSRTFKVDWWVGATWMCGTLFQFMQHSESGLGFLQLVQEQALMSWFGKRGAC